MIPRDFMRLGFEYPPAFAGNELFDSVVWGADGRLRCGIRDACIKGRVMVIRLASVDSAEWVRPRAHRISRSYRQ